MKQLCQQDTAYELSTVEGIFKMVPVPAELPPHRPYPPICAPRQGASFVSAHVPGGCSHVGQLLTCFGISITCILNHRKQEKYLCTSPRHARRQKRQNKNVIFFVARVALTVVSRPRRCLSQTFTWSRVRLIPTSPSFPRRLISWSGFTTKRYNIVWEGLKERSIRKWFGSSDSL